MRIPRQRPPKALLHPDEEGVLALGALRVEEGDRQVELEWDVLPNGCFESVR